ncbi:hypothetical protein [Paracoccus aestuariivivens]|uniref:Uncharacterized protein n=1 Tax=Paracoccus aestuariivivens TaxID=1820333 RepID=A0A6L6JCS1_9RHOB|nr:hypothetical protein [Paracoccus aestuariivivens]MTH78457.1 hypothetical protein [Paracoccus aestuariivivens]
MRILTMAKSGIATLSIISLSALAFAPAAEARGGFHGGRTGGMHLGTGGHKLVIHQKAKGNHPAPAHHKPPAHGGQHPHPKPPAGHRPPPPPPPNHHNDHNRHDHHDHHHPSRGPYWPGYWHDDHDNDLLWGAVAALAIGTIIHNAPKNCSEVQVRNHLYKHCGNTWLQAAYSGHQLVYIAVDDPR